MKMREVHLGFWRHASGAAHSIVVSDRACMLPPGATTQTTHAASIAIPLSLRRLNCYKTQVGVVLTESANDPVNMDFS
jgi:hypothetical protein